MTKSKNIQVPVTAKKKPPTGGFINQLIGIKSNKEYLF